MTGEFIRASVCRIMQEVDENNSTVLKSIIWLLASYVDASFMAKLFVCLKWFLLPDCEHKNS